MAKCKGLVDEWADATQLFDPPRGGDAIFHAERFPNDFNACEDKGEKRLKQYKRVLDEINNSATRFVLQILVVDEESDRAATEYQSPDLQKRGNALQVLAET